MSRAARVIQFIEAFCRVPEGMHVGQPLKLELFQKRFIKAVYDNPHGTEKAILSIARKNGKALALNTPIPTPDGWKTMGDLREGDRVFDEKGQSCNVTFATEVQHGRECFEIEFSDGSVITADADHQWTVSSRSRHGRTLTLQTRDMLSDYILPYSRSDRTERNYSVPVNLPVSYSEKELLVPPYTLGAWLGDGKNNPAVIYTHDNDAVILEEIRKDGIPSYKLREKFAHRLSDGVRNRAKDCLQKRLRALGVLRGKHIPVCYLQSSEKQRRALLQGLMDTDGYASKTGQCEFTSSNERLAYGVLELARSLGHKATCTKTSATLHGKVVNDKWRVQFWAYQDEPCFRLPRKKERLKVRPSTDTRNNRKYIVRITPVESVPVKCITVDSPSSLYLAGEGFTPTHNTGLIAALLLAHLVGPEARQNSQIVSGAMSKDQAAIVFKLACKMINLNPALAEIVHIIPSGKKLHGLPMNTEYQALAAEGKTAQGLSPVLAILDEVGQVRGAQDDFVDAIVTAQGAHEHPLLIAISTQAANDGDLLSIWIDDAEKSDDPHIVCHVYSAEPDADVMDKKAWKAANPALGKFRSLRDIEKLATAASRMPSAENTFRNLNLNQRVSTNNPFVSVEAWKSCGETPRPLESSVVYGGLDLSARSDLTALLLISRDEVGKVHAHPYFWTPADGLIERAKRDRAPYDVWAKQGFLRTTPGATVDYGFVVADILEILAGLDVRAIAFDRWRMDVFKKALEQAGASLPLVEHGQGFRDMSPAIDTLESDILNKRLCHGNHPVLAMCAMNAVLQKDPAGNRKLDKHKATGRIDGMVALAMALAAETKEAEPVITSEQMDNVLDAMVIM